RAVPEVVVRVQSIDDVQIERRAGDSKPQDLADPKIELVDPVAELRVRLDQIDGGGGHLCQRSTQSRERRTRDLSARIHLLRGQADAWTARERPRELYVDLRDQVAEQAL